jgi:hypothetical protein
MRLVGDGAHLLEREAGIGLDRVRSFSMRAAVVVRPLPRCDVVVEPAMVRRAVVRASLDPAAAHHEPRPGISPDLDALLRPHRGFDLASGIARAW